MSDALIESASPTSTAPPAAGREPRGYTLTYGLASYGLFLAILTPALGGLALKIQSLVGLDRTTAQLGIVAGVGAAFAMVAQPLVGRLSDRTTARMGMRKPWIITGVVGAAASLVLVGIAPSIPVVLVGWCLAQTFSNFAQAAETATIPDQVPVSRRGVVSGVVGACTPLAILSGAFGLARLPNDQARFAVPALLALVLGLLFALTLKDRVLPAKPTDRFDLGVFLRTFVFNPRRFPNLGWAWLTKAMIMFGYGTVSTYMIVFLGTKFGMGPQEQANFNLWTNLVSVGCMVVLSLVSGPWSDRVGRRKPFVLVGGCLVGGGVLLMALAPLLGHDAGLALVLVSQAILGSGAGLFFAVDMALCTEVLPDPENTAKDLGVLNIANTLPQMIAPFIAGTLVIPLGDALVAGSGYSVWFALGAAVAVAGGLLVSKIKGVR